MQRTGLRANLLFILATACMVALVGRLCYIHACYVNEPVDEEGKTLAEHVEQQQRTTITIPARRGEILDARNRVLAGSQDLPSIFADPSMIEDVDDAAAKLSPVLDMPAREIRRLLGEGRARQRTPKHFVWLRRRVDPTQGDAIHKLNLLGIGVVNESYRRYPMGSIAAHVVGFVNIDDKGLEGIERRYNDLLRGKPAA